MVLLIASEATIFLLLAATYFYLRTRARGAWPPAPLHDPALLKPLLVTGVLVASSLPIAAAARAAKQGRNGGVRLWLSTALALEVAFLIAQWLLVDEQLDVVRPQASAYGSIYYTLIGVHFVHVAVAALLGIWALLRSRLYTPSHHLTLRVTSLYWHFVNVAAVIVFLTLYVSPRA
jgi:heme/copper-type cytochrome/quinol oxidase subunit 3